ncbi:MAG: Gfo/Idh/MocA family oxidoreductase [Phycisphaerae bacterium]|nr:Gfo/Idh/MocA family oxidoreductase [Phycisphaerae bacterium]
MDTLNRRAFLRSSLGVAGTLALWPPARARGANDKIVVGVMGLGGRGTYLAEKFAERSDAEVAYLCDPNTRRFARAREAVEEAQDRPPKMLQDFRKMLDDKSVDVIINATPDHWHALGSILACQAGKDVFVEKPLAHNIWEGRKMVEAARKHQRVVQVGMQSRSAPYVQKARDYILAGKLGEVYLVRVYNMMQHPKQADTPDGPVPDGFDYELWCGPAPKRPYNPSRQWLNQWDYSCGPIAGDAVHQFDLARFLTGDIPYPKAVSQTGAIRVLRGGRDMPDTQMALFEYDNLTITLDATLWTPYMKKIPAGIRDSDQFPNWPFCATKVEVLGTEGFMYFGRHGGGWQAYDRDGELVHSEYGRQGDKEHQDNFVECVRSRKRATSDVEIGHLSVLPFHIANISYRVGNQRLEFDGATESFTNCDEANQYLKRQYRPGWTIPENV